MIHSQLYPNDKFFDFISHDNHILAINRQLWIRHLMLATTALCKPLECVDEAFLVLLRYHLSPKPQALLRRRPLQKDAAGEEEMVVERSNAVRRPPPVVHLEEPHRSPVRQIQHVVADGNIVGVFLDVPHRPLRELGRQTCFGVPDQAHDLGEGRVLDLITTRCHIQTVDAVAVVASLWRQQLAQERTNVCGKDEVDVGVGRQIDRSGPALPQNRGDRFEGGAPVSRLSHELLFDVVDGELREVEQGRHAVERDRGRLPREPRWSGDGVSEPDRLDGGARKPASDLSHRFQELARADAVEHHVAELDPHCKSTALELRYLRSHKPQAK